MIGFFSKRKEERTRLKIKQLLDEGLTKVAHRLYNQGMINFNNAIALDSKIVGEILEKNFNRFYDHGDWDSALSIGSVLLQIKTNHYKLANKTGNCARRTGDFKQANNLYRIALRSNKKYKEAFYNLAASMGKVPKYDLEVKQIISKFIHFDHFILPDYLGNPDFLDELEQEVISEYQEQVEVEAEQSDLKIEKYQPTYDEIIVKLDQKITRLSKKLDSKIALKAYHQAIYNECIYALANHDHELSSTRLNELKHVGSQFEYYEMIRALILSSAGEYEKATEIVIRLLGKDRNNRFYNVNLGLIYQKRGNRLLMTKYLAIGAYLLEKSEGLYRLSDLYNNAVAYYQDRKFRKSLALFKIVISESEDAKAWCYIGDICMEIKNISSAVKAYQKISEIDPLSEVGETKLKEVHDLYVQKGNDAIIDKKTRVAANYFKKALSVSEIPETFHKAIELFKKLKDLEQTSELQKRIDAIQQKEKMAAVEELRQELILKGKQHLKNRKFKQAITTFEQAFKMKLDKDVFMYLALIYKNLRKKPELEDLMTRWEKMQDEEETLRKRERHIARSKKAAII